MAAVFECDKCGESPEGQPSGVLVFKDKEGIDQNFTKNSSPLTLCESCAPKLWRLIDGFLKR